VQRLNILYPVFDFVSQNSQHRERKKRKNKKVWLPEFHSTSYVFQKAKSERQSRHKVNNGEKANEVAVDVFVGTTSSAKQADPNLYLKRHEPVVALFKHCTTMVVEPVEKNQNEIKNTSKMREKIRDEKYH
jgi:hypothetical protein